MCAYLVLVHMIVFCVLSAPFHNSQLTPALVDLCSYSFDSRNTVIQQLTNSFGPIVPVHTAHFVNTVIWLYFVFYLISYAAVRTKIKRTSIIQQRNCHTCFIYDMGSVRN